ncbi:MAG: ABC transporter permease subunit, partial [Bacillota bacterium]
LSLFFLVLTRVSSRIQVMLILPLSYFVIFRYIPMTYIQIAFKKYSIVKSPWEMPWADNGGFEYFIKAFSNRDFLYALRNTVMLNLLDLVFGFPAPIILALLLNELPFKRLKRITQTTAYLPHFLSWIIIAGMALQLFAPTSGLINIILKRLGYEPIPFLNEPVYWVFTYVFLGIWQSVGWNTIIYLAALTSINPELYEAAAIDGAGRLKSIWYVTLPSIRPTIITLLILSLARILGSEFDRPYALGNALVNLFISFVPEKFSDKDTYIYGFDDRQFLYPGVKEAVRKLNEWYNAGLIWKDFPLYGAGDPTEDNLIKAGYVGAFMHNWDYPYRGGVNGIHAMLKKTAGPDAAFIAVDPFKNDAGKYRKILYPPVDRKVFFPITNKEPLASLLYLDWISKFENRKFLQIGEKGINHEVLPDGTIKLLSATGPQIMNSPYNIDYTIVVNGLDLGNPELTARSRAFAYAEVEPRYIVKAIQTANRDGRTIKHYNCGEIKSEAGMDAALKQKRDNLLIQAIVCKPEEFDKVWDKGFQDYLNSGGQAIINERREKWEKYYGKKK